MIYRSKLVELITPANVARGDEYNFANDSDLQFCHIAGISAVDSRSLSQSPSGAQALAALNGLTLTLTEFSQKERQRNIPLTDLQPSNNGGFIRWFYPFDLNWQDSYITVNDPATFNPGEAAMFVVYYIPNDEMPNYERLYAQYGQ
jgi:hypothetical protein